MKFVKFIKNFFKAGEREIAEDGQSGIFSAEWPFAKEEIYREFDIVLKENLGRMDKECLKRVEGVEITDMSVNADKWVKINYKLKYNNDVYKNSVRASDFKTAKEWAEHFYMEILQSYNPQENDPEIKIIIKKAAKEAERNLIFTRKTLGYCHLFWDEQKRILKDKYGIDWKTPAERNPGVCYD
ncbi:hypothetical protein KKF19_03500 [Patescibacteria group bacterium]|nr:hypothetical protein [Patescibacteria group bacterium]